MKAKLKWTSLSPFPFLFIALLLGVSVDTMADPYAGKTKKDENKKQFLFPYKEKVLSNGLRLMMVHNKTLPRLKLRFMLNRGSRWDPLKKAGLSLLTARSLQQGTRFHNYLQLSAAFAQIGSELKVEAGFDSISFVASTLSTHEARLLHLMKQVLISPRMDKKDFSREKYKLIQRAKTLPDNRISFTTRLFYETLFPSPSLYRRPEKGWQRTLKRIRHEDVVRHYFQHYHPNHFILMISGDIQEDFIKKIERSFWSWKKKKAWKTAYTPREETQTISSQGKAKRHLRIIHQKGLDTSYLLLGSQGKSGLYEKDMNLRLATLALSSGRTSRLHVALKEKTSLVYTARAQHKTWKETGAFVMETMTASKNTAKVLSKMLSLFSKWHRKGITWQELKKAKNTYRNTFASLVETSENMADTLAFLYSLGIAKPYQKLESNLEAMERVSLSDIKKALKEALSLKDLQVFLLGDKDQMGLEKIQKMKWTSFKVIPWEEAPSYHPTAQNPSSRGP